MSTARPAQPADPRAGARGILCPYCGQVSRNPKRCDACGGFFDPLSRQASQNAMGPWFIRDARGPFRPGCSFETVRELVKRGKVTWETIIRGPATRQFWNFAGRTPTVANLLGICHNCGGDVPPDAYSCAACGAVFTPETDRQHLGLAPVHLLPGQAAPEIIAAASGAPARAPRENGAAAAPVEPLPVQRPRRLVVAGVLIGAMTVLGAVAAVQLFVAGGWRGVLEELAGRPGPAPAVVPAAPADPAPVPSDGAAPSGAAAPSGERDAAPADPPAPSPSEPEPVDEFGPVRRALAAGGEINEVELLGLIEDVKRRHPGRAEEADALAELVRRRAEQERLKRLP